MKKRQWRQFVSGLPPLSLYVHLPWCVSKCPYCDFNSYVGDGMPPEEEYIRALITDLKSDLAYIAGRSFVSVFIGGGTPSLFGADAIARLLSEIRRCVPLVDDCEITMEANPDSADAERFKGYRSAGVNRLSIGIQSFDNDALRRLSRTHDTGAAQQAVVAAQRAGFDNLNLDLMFGLPQQTAEEALADVRCALSFKPSHISYYQLTLEPNTVFYKFPPPLPAHDEVFRFQQAAMSLLQSSGYSRYEVSAFGKIPCRHNLNYWRFGDYLGIGAGAHSKLSVTLPDKVMRRYKTRMPQAYMRRARGDHCAREWVVDRDSMVFEFLMNTLRLDSGVELAVFERHTGLPAQLLEEKVAALIERGELKYDSGCIRTTQRSYWFLDQLLEECLPQGSGLAQNMDAIEMVYSQAGTFGLDVG